MSALDKLDLNKLSGIFSVNKNVNPIMDEVVLIVAQYLKMPRYIKSLLVDDENNIGLLPVGSIPMERLLKHKDLTEDELFLIKRSAELLGDFCSDYKKIETKNKFFIECAIGDIYRKLDLAWPMLAKVFEIELKRNNLNILNSSDEEIKTIFKGRLFESPFVKHELLSDEDMDLINKNAERSFLNAIKFLTKRLKIQT